LLFPLFVGSVIVAKVVMAYTTLTPAEIAGAGLALCAWGVLALDARLRDMVIALLFGGYVVAERLEPFQFAGTAGPFSWIPFLGFMSSSPEIGVLSFFQKFFLFGSSIWLLARAGLQLWSSTLVVAVILFITSQAETFLPKRSAEITDAVMALLIGACSRWSRAKPDAIAQRSKNRRDVRTSLPSGTGRQTARSPRQARSCRFASET